MSLKKAKEVIAIEAKAIKALSKKVNAQFTRAVSLIAACKGRVVVTGMGKTGIIGRKIAATLSSTGTPSIFLHSAEAVHGDLGQITKDDILILISNSGETEETKRLIPLIKRIKTKTIAMTGNVKSTLAKHCDVTIDVGVEKEGCPLGLAPMASTTATLVMGDALAACLIERKKFKRKDFAFFHPGGALGKELLLVEDLMRKGSHCSKVRETAKVKSVLLSITKARCGSACVVNKKGELLGIFTDGDLRRHLDDKGDILQKSVKDVMTKNPSVIVRDDLAVEALDVLKAKGIDELPVVDGKKCLVGLLDIQDLLKMGFV
ncbi:MAG: arabinose-5-phosphate isomerase [Candidatus Omnitrophota bacterium]|jgi:arabinose-5-phosphate isomerase